MKIDIRGIYHTEINFDSNFLIDCLLNSYEKIRDWTQTLDIIE